VSESNYDQTATREALVTHRDLVRLQNILDGVRETLNRVVEVQARQSVVLEEIQALRDDRQAFDTRLRNLEISTAAQVAAAKLPQRWVERAMWALLVAVAVYVGKQLGFPI
jgi:hypothetical protein